MKFWVMCLHFCMTLYDCIFVMTLSYTFGVNIFFVWRCVSKNNVCLYVIFLLSVLLLLGSYNLYRFCNYLYNTFLILFLLLVYITTVSYTHLDVYKRQSLLSFVVMWAALLAAYLICAQNESLNLSSPLGLSLIHI